MPWPHQALERPLLMKPVAVGHAAILGSAGMTVPHVIPHCPCTVTKCGQEHDPPCSQQMDPSQQCPGTACQRWDNLVKGKPVS